MKCKDCRWYKKDKHLTACNHEHQSTGYCQKYAPRAGFGFPYTNSDEYCGDFEVMEKENAK